MNAQIGALAAQLKRHEGCRLVAYRDTEGLWTIGYGHLLPDQSRDWTGHRISQTEADRFFEADLPIAVARAKAFANFSQLDPIRRAVLINMAFNLGRRLKQFKRLGAALFAHDYTAAAAEMLDSQWARQVKARATELASIMRTGQWPEETTP